MGDYTANMNLKRQIALELYKKIPESYNTYFKKLQVDLDCKDLDLFATYYEFVHFILQEEFGSCEDYADKKNSLNRNITKMKKRWVADYLTAKGAPKKDGLIYQEMLEKYKDVPEALIAPLCNAFLDEKCKQLTDWLDDRQAPLHTFPYIHLKTVKKQYSAFYNDTQLIIAKILSSDYDSNIEWVVPRLTHELIVNPIFEPKQTMLDLILDDEYRDEPIIVDEYYTSEDYFLRTFVKNEDRAIIRGIYSLDQIDRRIISLIYSMIKPGFYKNREIIINLSSVANQIYAKPNHETIKDIEDRIKKIGKYQCELIPNMQHQSGRRTREYMLINFFERVIIEYDMSTGRVQANLKMGETLYTSFLKKATYHILPNTSGAITNSLAKLLLPMLQDERLKLISMDTYDSEMQLDYFKSIIRFRYKRESTIPIKIKQALDQFIENKIVLESYSYNSHDKVFKLKFLPLSDEEKYIFGFKSYNITQSGEDENIQEVERIEGAEGVEGMQKTKE